MFLLTAPPRASGFMHMAYVPCSERDGGRAGGVISSMTAAALPHSWFLRRLHAMVERSAFHAS